MEQHHAECSLVTSVKNIVTYGSDVVGEGGLLLLVDARQALDLQAQLLVLRADRLLLLGDGLVGRVALFQSRLSTAMKINQSDDTRRYLP